MDRSEDAAAAIATVQCVHTSVFWPLVVLLLLPRYKLFWWRCRNVRNTSAATQQPSDRPTNQPANWLFKHLRVRTSYNTLTYALRIYSFRLFVYIISSETAGSSLKWFYIEENKITNHCFLSTCLRLSRRKNDSGKLFNAGAVAFLFCRRSHFFIIMICLILRYILKVFFVFLAAAVII